MKLQRLDLVGLGLLLATALTWAVGESGWLRSAGSASATFILVLALVKGAGIALDFMELREAPRLWRWFVLGWLLLVIGLIVGVRLLAGR